MSELLKPKYLRVASDLHLEQYFGQNEPKLADMFIQPDMHDKESVLILAGDISSKLKQLVPFLEALRGRFLQVVYIPGNHEFYGYDINEWDAEFREAVKDMEFLKFAVHGVSHEEMEGVRLIYTPLWADGGKDEAEQKDVGKSLRDFYVIRKEGKLFTVPDMMQLFKGQKARIKELLATPFDGKTVVITHHMPSYRLCHPRFGNSINGGFAGYCDDLLAADNAPNLWIHGHTHDTDDSYLWKCRIICNPSGYFLERNPKYHRYQPTFVEIARMNEKKEKTSLEQHLEMYGRPVG